MLPRAIEKELLPVVWSPRGDSGYLSARESSPRRRASDHKANQALFASLPRKLKEKRHRPNVIFCFCFNCGGGVRVYGARLRSASCAQLNKTSMRVRKRVRAQKDGKRDAFWDLIVSVHTVCVCLIKFLKAKRGIIMIKTQTTFLSRILVSWVISFEKGYLNIQRSQSCSQCEQH